MKNFIASVVVSLASLAFASPEIRNVTAKQRFPWNGKVDITYEVMGDVAEGLPTWNVPTLLVTMTNRMIGPSYEAVATALSGDMGIMEGVHHVVWDLNAQGIVIKSDDVVFTVAMTHKTYEKYCVIDLSAGENAANYPVAYQDELPNGGFNVDEYKTTKLVMRLIEPGEFKMGGSCDVILTQPYYCGIFEVTKKQYSLVMGGSSSSFSGGDKWPVEHVSYNMIRGSKNGAGWPSSSAVDASSFMGKLRARTGLDFDLPTEAQWEYACRAGTTTIYSYGSSADGSYMWYSSNSNLLMHEVGTKLPNSFGLYDMHGNVWEWCLDWYGDNLMSGVMDPKGFSSGLNRVARGGSGYNDDSCCTSSYRNNRSPSTVYGIEDFGFRLVRTLSD